MEGKFERLFQNSAEEDKEVKLMREKMIWFMRPGDAMEGLWCFEWPQTQCLFMKYCKKKRIKLSEF